MVPAFIIFSFSTAEAGDFIRILEEYYSYDANCSGERLYMTVLTNDWYEEMKTVENIFESEMVDRALKWYFTDPDYVSWGYDSFFLEQYDIALVASDSMHSVDSQARFFFRMNEYYESTCLIDPKNQMRLGEEDGDDIEILQVIANHSMTVDYGIYSRTWFPVFQGIHQVHGFHGNTWDVYGLADNYEMLAANGFDDSVALTWVSELYQDNFIDGYDNCPVAMAGNNTSVLNAALQLVGETYGNRENYTDVVGSYFARRFHDVCDPDGADAM